MRKILVLLACAAVLSGCAPKSNIVSPDSTEGTVAGQPDFDAKDDVEIDWEQAKVDAEDIFTDTKEYPYSVDFHLLLQPEQKEIMLVWVVKDDLPSNQIAKYSEALVKGFNDMVATQDFSIERSSDTSYGDSGRPTGSPMDWLRRVPRTTRIPGLSAEATRRERISSFRQPRRFRRQWTA